MNDKEHQALIRSAQAGDRSALEALIRGSYNSMYKMAYKWCGDRETAQDIVQDSCIKVVRHINGFRFQASFSSWLYRIVVNTASDHYKRKRPALPLDEESDGATDGAATTATSAADRLHARQVLHRVQSLPEREKTALLLVFGEGMNHKEAAFSMECKESTVSGYIHQARKKLRAFAGEGENHG